MDTKRPNGAAASGAGTPVDIVARKAQGPARASRPFLSAGPRRILDASYCVLSDEKELRGAHRRVTKLRFAQLEDLRRAPLGDCAIQDVSSTGARLRIDPRRSLPARFVLMENGEAALVSLAWRDGVFCGVRRLGPAPRGR